MHSSYNNQSKSFKSFKNLAPSIFGSLFKNMLHGPSPDNLD